MKKYLSGWFARWRWDRSCPDREIRDDNHFNLSWFSRVCVCVINDCLVDWLVRIWTHN